MTPSAASEFPDPLLTGFGAHVTLEIEKNT
jgi:hypothetical protein